MPLGAPAVVTSVRVTVAPEPSDGVTGFGAYVIEAAPPSIVPSVRGFWGSRRSACVLRVTVPAKDWFRETLSEPALAVVPVVGSVSWAGGVIAKSGMAMTLP